MEGAAANELAHQASVQRLTENGKERCRPRGWGGGGAGGIKAVRERGRKESWESPENPQPIKSRLLYRRG